MPVLSAIVVTATGLSGATYAQQTLDEQVNWKFSVDAGILSAPIYSGDDESQLIFAPSVRVTYGEHWAIPFADGVQYTVNPKASWRWGLSAAPFLGRESDGNNPLRLAGDGTNDLLELDDTDPTIALRIFTEYRLSDWSLTAEAVQSVSSDAQAIFNLGLRRSGTIKIKGPPLIISSGFSLRAGNQQSMQSLVGVTSEQSSETNLTAYRPRAGLMALGINGTVILAINRSMSILSTASIEQLGSELTDSSLITERGDSLQVTVGMFLNYRLGVKAAPR